MNRWVTYLLLVSVVRLQFVCCCGSIVHLEFGYEASAVEEHSHGDSDVSHDGSACCSSQQKQHTAAELCLEPCNNGSGCDHGQDGPHQHHLHVLHAAMMSASPQQSMVKFVLSSLDPFVETTFGVESNPLPILSMRSWHVHSQYNVSILTQFGQLRI